MGECTTGTGVSTASIVVLRPGRARHTTLPSRAHWSTIRDAAVRSQPAIRANSAMPSTAPTSRNLVSACSGVSGLVMTLSSCSELVRVWRSALGRNGNGMMLSWMSAIGPSSVRVDGQARLGAANIAAGRHLNGATRQKPQSRTTKPGGQIAANHFYFHIKIFFIAPEFALNCHRSALAVLTVHSGPLFVRCFQRSFSDRLFSDVMTLVL